jgi:phosphatidate cytidylyltransferase
MALNWQTFKTRTGTAIIFVIVMLAGLLINHWTFFILFSIIHFGCWVEYQKLVGLIDKNYQDITPFHKYGVMIAGWCIMLYFTNDSFTVFGLRLHELGWWLGLIFIFVLPIVELLFAKQVRPKNIGHSFFGLIYISLSLGLMMDLYKYSIKLYYANHLPPFPFAGFYPAGIDYKWSIPILIIGAIWINDTMAYIIGSWIGKTPLSKISPKKTWEGTIGGAILAIGIAALIAWLSDLNIFQFTITTVIIVIAGTFGDLLESKLKRLAGVKDSGHIMPGHGGFLDRFDSLLVAIPFVWLFVYFFMR